jgi:hypothetical protein
MNFEEHGDNIELMEEISSSMDLEEHFEMIMNCDCPKCSGNGCGYCLGVESISTK